MRRQILRATPAMIRRAAALYAPLTLRPPILARKRKRNAQQLDLETNRPVERAAVHVHENVDSDQKS